MGRFGVRSLTGHLRARPDPWLEWALREALAEFDRELAVILHDRSMPAYPTACMGAPRPGDPDFLPGQPDNS